MQTRVLSLFFSLFILFIAFPSVGQEEYDEEKLMRVSRTYGYLKGQNYSLDKIGKEFPDLKSDAIQARLNFETSFGRVQDEIDEYLLSVFGKSDFEEFKKMLNEELQPMMDSFVFTKEEAEVFLEEMDERTNGIMESPVRETMLHFQFHDRPADEFVNGHTYAYEVAGHPKAKGTDWKLDIPVSWKAGESEQPSIIQKFTSDHGSGKETIMILNHDLGLGADFEFSDAELDDLYAEESVKEMVPQGANYIESWPVTLKGIRGVAMVVEQRMAVDGNTVKVRMVQYTIVHKGTMYFVQGAILSEDLQEDLSRKMKKYASLFDVVAKSIEL